MKCLVCGNPCSCQTDLDGQGAQDYPHLCTACNRVRKSNVLLMTKDLKKYAFVPRKIETPKGPVDAQVPSPNRHPRNWWLVPKGMLETVLEKVYPLSDDEKAIKRRISRLQSEKEDLEGEIAEIEGKIEELEDTLSFNPDNVIQTTWMGSARRVVSA